MRKHLKKILLTVLMISIGIGLISFAAGTMIKHDLFTDKYDDRLGVPILTYHRVVTHDIKTEHFPNDKWTSDLDDFKSNMKYLYENGYKTLSMNEFYNWYIGEAKFDLTKTVLITFDDGDVENYYNVLPVLKEYGFSATVFAIGERTPKTGLGEPEIRRTYMSEELIAKMKKEYPAFEVQSHSHGFHKKINGDYAINVLGRDEIKKDLDLMSDKGYRFMAYPYGIRSELSSDVFRESEFKLAFGFGQPDLKYRRAYRSDRADYIARIKVDATSGKPENFPELLKKETVIDKFIRFFE